MKKKILLCLLLLSSVVFAQINTQVSPLYACNSDGDQETVVNLTSKISEILGASDPSNYTVDFFYDNMPIANPTALAVTVPSMVITAKVKNIINQQITTVSINVIMTQMPAQQSMTMQGCDPTDSGIASFNIGTLAGQYLSSPSGPYQVTFHTSIMGALYNAAPILNWSFTNTVPFEQVIYMRIQKNGCYIINSVTLNVTNCTMASPEAITTCANNTGMACFNLESHIEVLLNESGSWTNTVTYHETQQAAENNTTPIALLNSYCVSQPTTVYARISYQASAGYEVVPVTLTPTSVIIDTAQGIINLNTCDDNNDLSVVVNLNFLAGNGATYYTSQADAVAGVNAITNATSYVIALASSGMEIFIRTPQGETCARITKAILTATPCSDSNNNNNNTATVCSEANPLCGALGNSFGNTVDTGSTGTMGCLATTPNPAWFYMPVSLSGNLTYNITQTSMWGTPLDVDYICYGPFNSPSEGCESLTNANMVACSFSPSPTENFTITNAQAGKYYLLMVTNFSNQAGYITINEMAQNQGALSCSGLQMQAFIDLNSNGVKDAGENGFALGNFTYEANDNGIVHTITDTDGFYSLYDENVANNYDIAFNVHPQYAPYYNVATSSYTNLAVQPGNLVQTYYFPVTVIQPYNDLAVNIIGNSAPRPGFTYQNKIVYTNLGISPISTGTLSFTKDAAVSITNVSQTGITATSTGFNYTFTNMLPFETRTITVTMQVPVIPTVTLGQLIESSASIAPLTGDVNTANNTSVSAQEIIGSYDPNDKMESRGERILITEFDNNDYLYYTIRFQNTGTAHAEIVRIQDILDSQLDQNTVEMIRSSHNYSLDRVNNILTWTFTNIMLPASNVNEPASHGYVYFRVKPRPGFEVGDIIRNGASIFFDFNPAIVTNTVNSEFVAAMGVDEISQAIFTMYPNPANGTVNLQLDNTGDSIKSVRVYDLTGKAILVNNKAGETNKLLDISGISAGAYMVEVITDSNFRTVKKLMVK